MPKLEIDPEKVGTVAASTNGVYYKITAPGRVQRVNAVDVSKFIKANDVSGLVAEEAEQNTRVLLGFLKKTIPETVFKRGYVYVSGYRIAFSSHGYEIVDTWNFSKRVNVNKFNNDYPDPESVLGFLNKHKGRKLDKPSLEEKSVIHLGKLSDKFKIGNGDSPMLKKLKQQKLKEQEELRKAKIERDRKAAKRERQKEKMKRRQPLFRGLPADEIVKAAKVRGKIVVTYQGPTKKMDKTYPEHLFFVEYLIREDMYPRSMAMLMRIATKGERFDLDKLSGTKFVVDPYVAYDPNVIKKSRFAPSLIKMCEEVLARNGDDHPLNLVYGSKLKKRQRIRVYYRDINMWVYGTITSSDRGLYFMAEDDGEARPVYKHQKVETL